MRTATDTKQYAFSFTEWLAGDNIGSENARQAAANEHSQNMALIGAQDSSDRRSYLYNLLALKNQGSTQQAEVRNNANLYQTVAIVAAVVGAVLILKNI